MSHLKGQPFFCSYDQCQVRMLILVVRWPQSLQAPPSVKWAQELNGLRNARCLEQCLACSKWQLLVLTITTIVILYPHERLGGFLL